jgi:hypothetical protein
MLWADRPQVSVSAQEASPALSGIESGTHESTVYGSPGSLEERMLAMEVAWPGQDNSGAGAHSPHSVVPVPDFADNYSNPTPTALSPPPESSLSGSLLLSPPQTGERLRVDWRACACVRVLIQTNPKSTPEYPMCPAHCPACCPACLLPAAPAMWWWYGALWNRLEWARRALRRSGARAARQRRRRRRCLHY